MGRAPGIASEAKWFPNPDWYSTSSASALLFSILLFLSLSLSIEEEVQEKVQGERQGEGGYCFIFYYLHVEGITESPFYRGEKGRISRKIEK